jgi:hypothetical protein
VVQGFTGKGAYNMFDDFRSFIERLDEKGSLRRFKVLTGIWKSGP